MKARLRNSSGQWTPTSKDLEVVIPSGDDQEQLVSRAIPESRVIYIPPELRVGLRPKESQSHMPISFISWLNEVPTIKTPTLLQMTIIWLEILLMALRFTVFLTSLAFVKSLFFWDQASNLTNAMVAWLSGQYQSGAFHDAFFPDSASSASYQLHISLLPAAGEYSIINLELPILFNNPVLWLAALCTSWVAYLLLFVAIRCLKEAKMVVASHQAICKTST